MDRIVKSRTQKVRSISKFPLSVLEDKKKIHFRLFLFFPFHVSVGTRASSLKLPIRRRLSSSALSIYSGQNVCLTQSISQSVSLCMTDCLFLSIFYLPVCQSVRLRSACMPVFTFSSFLFLSSSTKTFVISRFIFIHFQLSEVSRHD